MAVKIFRKFNKRIFDQQGFSSIEAIVLMICFTLMVTFTFGVFGIIHTGILNSIGARNYAFETFRHRANLSYIRDADYFGGNNTKDLAMDSYVGVSVPLQPPTKSDNFRLHYVSTEAPSNSTSNAPQITERPIAKGKIIDTTNENQKFHLQIANEENLVAGKRYNNQDGVNPTWIKVVYGICMNAICQQQ